MNIKIPRGTANLNVYTQVETENGPMHIKIGKVRIWRQCGDDSDVVSNMDIVLYALPMNGKMTIREN